MNAIPPFPPELWGQIPVAVQEYIRALEARVAVLEAAVQQLLEQQGLARRLPDIETLKQEVTAWEQQRNQAQVTIDWRFTTEGARLKLKRFYPVLKEQKVA